MSNWLEFENVHFSYGDHQVFHGVSFQVDTATQVLGVVGKSGVGKSTLLSLAAGFLTPRSGKVWFDGQIVTGPSAERPVVFQDHNLFPWMTVLDNISLGLKARGMSRQSRYKVARTLIAETNLAGNENKYPQELSGGMQQRVGLARALAISPRCLLLDEPFGALDHKTKSSVYSVYRRLLGEHNMYAVHVTHDVTEAVELCGAVLLLSAPSGGTLVNFSSHLSLTTSEWVARIRRELAG